MEKEGREILIAEGFGKSVFTIAPLSCNIHVRSKKKKGNLDNKCEIAMFSSVVQGERETSKFCSAGGFRQCIPKH